MEEWKGGAGKIGRGNKGRQGRFEAEERKGKGGRK